MPLSSYLSFLLAQFEKTNFKKRYKWLVQHLSYLTCTPLTSLTYEDGKSPLKPFSSPSHHPSPTLVRLTCTMSPFYTHTYTHNTHTHTHTHTHTTTPIFQNVVCSHKSMLLCLLILRPSEEDERKWNMNDDAFSQNFEFLCSRGGGGGETDRTFMFGEIILQLPQRYWE